MAEPELSAVPMDSLLKEIQRRFECSAKPEKRLILIGATAHLAPLARSPRSAARSEMLLSGGARALPPPAAPPPPAAMGSPASAPPDAPPETAGLH